MRAMNSAGVLLVVVLCGCGGKKDGDGTSAAPPPAPETGAPLAFVVDKVKTGEEGELAVRAYNFSDKKIAQYSVLMRYYDKDGAVVWIKPGTPFEDSYGSWSFSGKKYLCNPKRWCSFTLKRMEVPDSAVRAEILASSLRALKDDVHFEEDDLFQMEGHEWPGADKEPARQPDAFKQWGDPAAAMAVWQGAWAGDGFGLGNDAAWEITGDKIAFVDGKGEQSYTLTIDSPCTAGFGGGDGGWISVFTVKDGQLITGLGDAGMRKGDKAIVCGGGSVWVFEGGTCTRWEDHFKRWESAPGKCGFKKDEAAGEAAGAAAGEAAGAAASEPKEVFFYVGSGDYESKLLVDGDTIWSEQLSRSHAKKFADLAAAKAAQSL